MAGEEKKDGGGRKAPEGRERKPIERERGERGKLGVGGISIDDDWTGTPEADP